MIADRARLRTMLANLARTLHVGVLADCFSIPVRHVPEQAMRVDKKAPLTALCEPTDVPTHASRLAIGRSGRGPQMTPGPC